MASDLIAALFEEERAEFLREKATLEEQKATLEEQKATLEDRLRQQALELVKLRETLQQSAEDIITARFPAAPLLLSRQIRAVTDTERLQTLIRTLLTVPDLATVEQVVQNARK